jgi:AGCS family alanine or glycine:cation symporter
LNEILDGFDAFWAAAVDIVWGLPLVILLVGAGVFFTVFSRFVPFRGAWHALQILRGKFDKPDDPGEISHFQALTSALSATLGMGNIGGVALAVSMGGPGAIFWMWIAGLVGMATKFFTCTLAVMYRKKDENGVEQGGPMYFIEVGLGRWGKPLAIMFAVCGMLGCLALFQMNQLSGLLANQWEVNRWLTGVVCALLVGIVILGGIKRVGQVTSKVVPAMFLLYFFGAIFVILANISAVPAVFAAIVKSAFGLEAVAGGAAGMAMKEILVTGVRRATFSNEAGMGTAPMAHGAAKTKEPVREGLIAMIGPFLDTHIICTMTALVLFVTGVAPLTGGLDVSEEVAVVMTAQAFESAMPVIGGYLLAAIVVLFAEDRQLLCLCLCTESDPCCGLVAGHGNQHARHRLRADGDPHRHRRIALIPQSLHRHQRLFPPHGFVVVWPGPWSGFLSLPDNVIASEAKQFQTSEFP